ncbi:MAG: mannose-1-phosphate guanylyltransferase [Bacteroidales bacterium]|jgi:mannose-1-phosphate guanylyltransferase|nr:mannose-1-phosphate guanylyltransferase [Bacteroidales bacterium]
MNKNNYCVIMAGGIGVRFWPMSKTETPKQFIDILGDGQTLIQKTFKRFSKFCPIENIYIVTNSQYFDLVKTQLPEVEDDQIVLEPARRNTAPCIAYANYKIKTKNPDAVVVVAPSDHIILKEDVFIDVITKGLETVSENDWLLTIGIHPSFPNTGYGYIQFNEDKPYEKNPSIYSVKTFTEKPTLEFAQQFLESGDFLWNAGIFMWSVKSIQNAFEQYLPEVDELFKKGEGLYNTPGEKEFINRIYQICRNISVDYGIMEKAQNVHVFAAEFGWSDLGTWGALHEMRNKDDNQNSVVGNKIKMYNTKNCIINLPNNKVAVIQGLEDYIVVDTDEVLLICKKEEEQQIKQYVTDVKIDFGDRYV